MISCYVTSRFTLRVWHASPTIQLRGFSVYIKCVKTSNSLFLLLLLLILFFISASGFLHYIDKNGTQRNNLHRCTYITTDTTPRLPSLSIKIVMTPSDSWKTLEDCLTVTVVRFGFVAKDEKKHSKRRRSFKITIYIKNSLSLGKTFLAEISSQASVPWVKLSSFKLLTSPCIAYSNTCK